MNILKENKIGKAVSDDKGRKPLQNPYLQGERLYATDGKLMASVKVEREDGDVDGYVPLQAIEDSFKGYAMQGHVALNGDAKLDDGRTYPRNADGLQFPIGVVEMIVKQADVAPTFTVSLNPHALVALAEALGVQRKGSRVILKFTANDKPIKVETDSENFGVIMPMKV